MILIDKIKAKKAFDAYTSKYDISDIKIRLKVDHTYRVAKITEEIAESIFTDQSYVDFAWLLGLLHDIGRFEQIKRYQTFNDEASIDHAELGADLLFQDGLIFDFFPEGFKGQLSDEDRQWLALAETAIRAHNKLKIPEGLDELTTCFCNLLRDGDKADIFRVLAEVPFEERTTGFVGIPGQIGARDEVMQYVFAHACVPRMTIRTEFETLISHACMGFELVYDKTKEIVKRQGYFKTYLQWEPKNDIEKKQMAILIQNLKECGL